MAEELEMVLEDISESTEDEFAVPIPIQTFLWGQTCPFIRPRLGKLHEATCVVSFFLIILLILIMEVSLYVEVSYTYNIHFHKFHSEP